MTDDETTRLQEEHVQPDAVENVEDVEKAGMNALEELKATTSTVATMEGRDELARVQTIAAVTIAALQMNLRSNITAHDEALKQLEAERKERMDSEAAMKKEQAELEEQLDLERKMTAELHADRGALRTELARVREELYGWKFQAIGSECREKLEKEKVAELMISLVQTRELGESETEELLARWEEELAKRVEVEEKLSRERELSGAIIRSLEMRLQEEKEKAAKCMRDEALRSVEVQLRIGKERLEIDKNVRSMAERVLVLQQELAAARLKEEKAVQRRKAEKLAEESRKKAERGAAELKMIEELHRAAEKRIWEERLKAERWRVAKELEEIRRKEKEWVAQEKLEGVKTAWKTYSKFWHQEAILQFSSVTWPMVVQPKRPQEIELAKIREFLLSPHLSDGRSDKQRVKDAMLLWHPDKFGNILRRLGSEETKEVLEGADIVAKHLSAILQTL